MTPGNSVLLTNSWPRTVSVRRRRSDTASSARIAATTACVVTVATGRGWEAVPSPGADTVPASAAALVEAALVACGSSAGGAADLAGASSSGSTWELPSPASGRAAGGAKCMGALTVDTIVVVLVGLCLNSKLGIWDFSREANHAAAAACRTSLVPWALLLRNGAPSASSRLCVRLLTVASPRRSWHCRLHLASLQVRASCSAPAGCSLPNLTACLLGHGVAYGVTGDPVVVCGLQGCSLSSAQRL